VAAPNLEHTNALPSELSAVASLLPSKTFAETNVMNSTLVNASVLCALISSRGNPAPAPGSELRREAPLTEVSQSEDVESGKVRLFRAEGRVEVEAPSQSFRLAEEGEVSLRIHAPGLATVESQQLIYVPKDMETRLVPTLPKGGFAVLPIFYHGDGSAYVKVIPRHLGKVVLKLRAYFPDGGYTNTETTITVGPPARSPEKLIVGQLGIPATNIREMRLYLQGGLSKDALTIGARYDNLKEQIQIDPTLASFVVRTANNASIIDLDRSTGRIKPLQPGEALVETTFGGWSNLTCVLVENKPAPSEGATPDCKSLLLDGERLATPVRKDDPQ
jgi:hypothetical protein